MYTPISSMGLAGITGIILIVIGIAFGNAAGVGGAGIIVPVLLVLFSFEIIQASALSNFMISISFLLRCYFNFKERHPSKNRPLIDYDTASLMLPASLVGTKLGVIIHDIFPHPLLMIMLTVTLFYLAYRSYLQGEKLAQNEKAKSSSSAAQPMVPLAEINGPHGILLEPKAPEQVKARIREIELEEARMFPPKKTALIMGLFGCLICSMIVEGGKGLPSAFGVQICSGTYWVSFLGFIAICAAVTYVNAKDINARAEEKMELGFSTTADETVWSWAKIAEYSGYGLVAGILSAIFGIGGGLILAPVLVQLKMRPEVVSATGGLFVLFTTASSSVILICEGHWIVSYGILMGVVGLGSSLLSIYVITGMVKKYGRPSVIVYIMAVVVLISGVTISGIGFYQDKEKYGSLFSGKLWSFHGYCPGSS